jgi:hypothetical protein
MGFTSKPERAYILSEIKRTAAENGGLPLGRVRFQQATGIKPADWEGTHWVRWGDAVAEAGFERNALNEAYDEEWLLSRLASLVPRLGRFPQLRELKLASRSDPEFPGPDAFRRRLGTKSQLAARLLAFCESRTGLETVASICRTAAPNVNDEKIDGPAPTTTEAFGAVYLLRSGRFYKIGRSNAVGRRERELRSSCRNEPKSFTRSGRMIRPASRRIGTDGSPQSGRTANGFV